MNENTNTERLSAEALAEIELSLDSIWLIPRTQRTISANAKIFGHAFALLASHRVLEAELAQARGQLEALHNQLRDEREEHAEFKRSVAQRTSTAAPDAGDLGARLAAVEQRLAALEAGRHDAGGDHE